MKLIFVRSFKNVVSDFSLETNDRVLKREETFESFTGWNTISYMH
jgi:hypothetical protein